MGLHQRTGADGEQLACEYLAALGMVILDRNWRCRYGELDAVCADHGVLVAVEVKTRRQTGFGDPAEAVTAAKLARMRRLLGLWRDAHAEHRMWQPRLDVVTVLHRRGQQPRLRHLRGVG
jgi:putative endonuclease